MELLILEVTPEEYDWISDQNECRTCLNGNLEYYEARITVNTDEWQVYQAKKLRDKLKGRLRDKLQDHYGTTSTTLTIQKIEQWLKDKSIIDRSSEE